MHWVKHVSPEVEAISQYPTILGVCGSLTLFTLLFVSLRTYTRVRVVKNFGWDDGCLLLLAVSLLAA
jgi:hypothetical protein